MKKPTPKPLGTSIEQLRKTDWDTFEKEVLLKMRILRRSVFELKPNPLNDKVANDIFLPCLRLLAEFIAAVEMKLDKENLDDMLAAFGIDWNETQKKQ